MEKTDNYTDFNLRNLPTEGHKDVAKFAWDCVGLALAERDRLNLPERWRWNNKMVRGSHWNNTQRSDKGSKITINLIFSNKQRIVANLTARNPAAEAIPLDGNNEGVPEVNTYLRKWWIETSQRDSLKSSVDRMEEYGVTFEKPIFNIEKKTPQTVVMDAFAVLIAPGYWSDIAGEAPYIAFLDAMPIEDIVYKFTVEEKDIAVSDIYSVMGEDREENVPDAKGNKNSYVKYTDSFKAAQQAKSSKEDIKAGRALVAEVWIRDYSKDKDGKFKYPGNIRTITVVESTKPGGVLLLADVKNPNINPAIDPEDASASYLWDRFPLSKANSFEDTTSIYGYSIVEQVGDLALKIDEIFSKMISWAQKTMAPIFVCPNGIGITREHLKNRVNLVLMPNRPIPLNTMGYIPSPNLPASFMNILQALISFFDRIYAIEEADRGVVPKNVIAASAITALQERNEMLMQHKVGAVKYLVGERGKCAISMIQNFAPFAIQVDSDGEQVEFLGTDLAGRKFNYVVETGSMLPRTSLQTEAMSEKYYQLGAIDRQALLENTNYPGWKNIVERVGEGVLGNALQVLVQAGLPQEVARDLQTKLLQSQGGPGGVNQVNVVQGQGG